MKPKNSFLTGASFFPIKIVLPYAVFSCLWIFSSDSLLGLFIQDHHNIIRLSIFKGVLYVIISSIILYFLFRSVTRGIIYSETKYRNLFENAAVSIWEEDFSGVKEFFQYKKAQGVSDWKDYFDNNPQDIMLCASLVNIRDVNQAGLRLLGVNSKEEIPKNLDHYFTEYSLGTFKEELIALAQGSTHWAGEIPARSLKGETIQLMFQLSVVPGYEKSLSKVLISIVDITERKKVEKVLRLNEDRLRQIIDLVPHFIFAKDIEGRFILVNQAVAQAYGTTIKNLIGKTDADFAKSNEEVDHFLKDDLEVIRSGKPKFIPQETITNAQGEVRTLSTTKIPFIASGVSSPCILGVAVDITESKLTAQKLQQSQHFVESILNATPNLIYIHDLINQCNIYCNRETLEFLGYTQQQIMHMGLAFLKEILHPDDLAKTIEHYQQFIKEGDVHQIEYRIKDASGQWRWLRSREVLFARTPQGEPWQILGSAEDVTERKYLENRLLTLAHYDILTSFPNRALFFEMAGSGLSYSRRSGTSCAVLFVDLDHFKTVNDTLGHPVGDELLKDTAVKLAQCVREMDTIARLGGDEFIVFLNSFEDAQSAQQIAERIREKFNSPRQILGNDLFVTASVGIATYPNDGNTLDDLLKNADTAMYAAKQSGRNTYCFFDKEMNQKAVARMNIERGLRDALMKSEFRLFYQPIINVKDNKIRGFEALLRWFRNDGVLVCPNDFISIAEETGLIVSLGEWVLKEACLFGRKLRDLGFKDHVMSVNISVAQLRRNAIVDAIRNALEETGLSPESLEIEVTESILIGSFDASIEVLQKIRDMGVRISLDDFGTGYSSLSQLQHLPITNLKIDRMFIKQLMSEDLKMAMTSTIIDLAHALNLGVVAEGVEFDLQLKRLTEEKCDYFQGFLFGQPMPEEVALSFIREHIILDVS